MFKNRVTDVFFDLDHTLWDFEKNSALAFERIFESHKVDIELNSFLEVYIPLNFQFWKLYREERISKPELRYQRLKKAFDKVNVEVSDDKINSLSAAYIEHLSSFNHIFPGTFEILDYLKPNYKLHIITNGFEEVQEKKMKNSKLLPYFDVVVNSEMAGVKKPDPKIFELALKKAKVDANRSIMIGDSLEADIIGAKNIGFHVLHFNSHKEKAHDICEMIDHLDEIKRFL